MSPFASPPFPSWTDTDHSSAVLIVSVLCMLYWATAGFLQQSFSLARGIRFAPADWFLSASMLSGFLQTVLILVSSSHGLGKSFSTVQPHQLIQAKREYYASNIFYVIALGLARCSATCFVANLTVKDMGSPKRVPHKIKIVMSALLSASLGWMVYRWEGIFSGDAVTDITIVVFAGFVVWRT
ncbi:hypothetical protein B0A54_17050 [Friedmanniomyces endolithicus]|uniref:Rhodopsin domain-containing protein n=1 Tax=Friedmanniomyces endolithicus TaxID=329885 RepID=A0A4U0TXG7_9PEZI|nr:hypothetical protein B0A54_17050 [Friedmanniomyces endolithicus]